MVDSHIHLSYRHFDQSFPYIAMNKGDYQIVYGDRQTLIQEMIDSGISFCIEPAIDVDSNGLLLSLSREYPDFIFPAVGNHPTRCIYSSLRDFKSVREYAKANKIIAIGETGLDYHYDRKEQHRIRQKIWFRWQINLADRLDLPLILHIRNADEDAISILRKNRKKLHGGVCHCFGGGVESARIYTEELGLCLGIGGTLLMKSEISAPLQNAVVCTSMDHLLLETDGPYVKPVKPELITRKKWEKARNTSLIIPAIAKKISELKGIPVENVLRITEENTRRVFGISSM